MSASPSKAPAGPASVTPTTGGPPAMRKKPPVSIFTQKKKPVKKAPAGTTPQAAGQAPKQPSQQQAPRPTTNGASSTTPPAPPGEAFDEYPIVVSKRGFLQGLHYHAMRLQSRQDASGETISVNPYDEQQFMRPVRLHRRSARDKIEPVQQSDAASGMDDKEREEINIKRAEREAEREAAQALVAPTVGDGKRPVKRKPQKKVEDVYYDENDPRQRQRAQLRYEEARPWHLEDFDYKNVWVGSYEEPLTETSVLFEIGEDGFKMTPVEKWYKFTQTNRVSAMDSEAVEKHMGKKFKPPRWFLGTQEANDEARRQAAMAKRAQMRGVDDEDRKPFVPKREEYQADMDEIDFEFNDEFQDDDEGFLLGPEENDDTKEIERRIREEMREANLGGTGVKDEDKDWDEEEQREKVKEQEERRRTKRIRKQLIKKERKNEYDSESDRGEFSESSESEDSEEERERLEEERKQEEARKASGDKSGASTRGTNTPSGRAEKKDPSKSHAASLKRPGSPDLSEMSGNESSRKKAKGANGRAMSPNGPNGARSLSPDAGRSRGAGSGSDTDTSRTGRPKLVLKNSPPGSPHDRSRAGSPSGSTSRAQSPQRGGPKASSSSAGAGGAATFPSLEEVRAAIPPDGIGITDLVKIFRARISPTNQSDFIALVKQAGKQDAGSRKILPKPVE